MSNRAETQLIELTEDGLAKAFVGYHKDQLRFAHDVGRWFLWDETRWQPQRSMLAFHWCRMICRKHNHDSKATIAKAGTAFAVEKFSRADPKLALVGDEFDLDGFLLA